MYSSNVFVYYIRICLDFSGDCINVFIQLNYTASVDTTKTLVDLYIVKQMTESNFPVA